MPKFEFLHHSISDWDFTLGAIGHSLSPTYYISAPTSLKLNYPSGFGYILAICRIAATQLLPQGELRTWFRTSVYYGEIFVFRSQQPLGSAVRNNCYVVIWNHYSIMLTRYVSGSPVVIGTWICTQTANIWEHFRLVWWNGQTPGGVDALAVDLYKELAGSWVKEGNTLYDTSNYWKNSTINRCGLSSYTSADYPNYHDDSEIWGP